jgi:multiple sugar transport system substrate-binding protein
MPWTKGELMSDSEQGARPIPLDGRRVTRRAVLRFGLLIAAVPLAAACGQPAPPAPTAAPAAKPTEAAKPAAPAAAASPAAGAPTLAQIPEPKAPSFNQAAINGKLTVVQSRDFHPDHNTFVEQKIREFADKMGYPLDHSWMEGFAGAGNVVQKLTATVQAGDPPDVIIHTLQPAELKFLDIIEDVDDLQKSIIKDYGKTVPGLERRALLDGKWWSVGHFTRSGSFWAVQKPFKDAGITDLPKAVQDFDPLRETLLKASVPEKELWGWGMTANRSGDGNTMTCDTTVMFGGQLTDESGQVVVLNKEPYRSYAIAAFEFLKETYTDPKWAKMLPPGVNAWTDPSNNEAYLAGKIFFTANAGTLFAKAVFDKNPVADDTILVPRPKGLGPGGRSLEGTDGMRFFIMKGAKNREAAEQLIRHLLSPDVMREIWKTSTGYAYPAYEWGWDEGVIKESKYYKTVGEPFKKIAWDPSGYIAQNFPGPPTPWSTALYTANFWTDMFGEVLGGKPVADAIKDGHDRAVRVFKEFGAKGE